MIGIIGAMDLEVEKLKEAIHNPVINKISGMDFISGNLMGQEVVVVKCGVGKVFAGICAQTMIMKYRPKLIVNIGVAGSLSDSLNIFDLIVAKDLIQHDFDISGLGYPKALLSGFDSISFPTSDKYNKLLINSIEKHSLKYQFGRIATGDQFISQSSIKEELSKDFSALACEMEGAAIAQVCCVNGVDFCELRSISDSANEDSTIDFPTFVTKATENVFLVINDFLNNLNKS